MNKLGALWNLFRQGSAVADAAAWKNKQITVTILAGLVIAIVNTASAFGYNLPIDSGTANTIAGGILAIVNTILTIITSDKVGISQKVEVPTLPTIKTEVKEEVKPNEETLKAIKEAEADLDKRGYPFTGASDG